jgi:hypothetical protein
MKENEKPFIMRISCNKLLSSASFPPTFSSRSSSHHPVMPESPADEPGSSMAARRGGGVLARPQAEGVVRSSALLRLSMGKARQGGKPDA